MCLLTEHRVAKDLNPGPRRHMAYRAMLGCCLEDEGSGTNMVLRCGVRGAAILEYIDDENDYGNKLVQHSLADKYGLNDMLR